MDKIKSIFRKKLSGSIIFIAIEFVMNFVFVCSVFGGSVYFWLYLREAMTQEQAIATFSIFILISLFMLLGENGEY